jgi:hypothetical protein
MSGLLVLNISISFCLYIGKKTFIFPSSYQ